MGWWPTKNSEVEKDHNNSWGKLTFKTNSVYYAIGKKRLFWLDNYIGIYILNNIYFTNTK